MNLQAQVDELRHQRNRALRTLDRTYLRTKRDLKRAASPSRMIRRHVGASLAIAAIVGFLLAPRPASRQPRPRQKSGLFQRLARFLLDYFPQLAELIPGLAQPAAQPPETTAAEPPEPPEAPSPRQPRPRQTLLRMLLGIVSPLLSDPQIRRLIVAAIRDRTRPRRHAHGNGQQHPPAAGELAPDEANTASESTDHEEPTAA